jgi:hypothetical protein
MADDVNEDIENALNKIVSTTEQSGNLRKDLKNTIYETVSTLRKLFVMLKDSNDSKTRAISKLEIVGKTKTELEGARSRTVKSHGAPSLIPRREPASPRVWGPVLPGAENAKLYSEVLGGGIKQKPFKLTVKSKESQSPDTIKDLLKSKINPTEIKMGINSLKSLRDGRVLIETGSKEEVETLTRDINEECRAKMVANTQ